VLLLAMLPTLGVALLGGALAARSPSTLGRLPWSGLVVLGLALTAGLVREFRKPRIAFDGKSVLFYVKAGAPVAIPLPVVESFFLGQGPAHLPLPAGAATESVNLVTRLSQKAPEFAHGDVKPALAQWCDGYLTLRGTWCEPLTNEVARQLNRQLVEAQKSRRAPASPRPKESPA
jgi:hypothetical protein